MQTALTAPLGRMAALVGCVLSALQGQPMQFLVRPHWQPVCLALQATIPPCLDWTCVGQHPMGGMPLEVGPQTIHYVLWVAMQTLRGYLHASCVPLTCMSIMRGHTCVMIAQWGHLRHPWGRVCVFRVDKFMEGRQKKIRSVQN